MRTSVRTAVTVGLLLALVSPVQSNVKTYRCGKMQYDSGVHIQDGDGERPHQRNRQLLSARTLTVPNSICKTCPTGYLYYPSLYKDKSSHNDPTCETCPRDTPCIFGQYRRRYWFDGRWSYWCAQCSKGQYSANTGCHTRTVCSWCPQGQYQPETGQGGCIKCVAGQYLSTLRSAGPCHKCQAGRFSANEGQTSCDPCPVGYYQEQGNAQSCQKCEAGLYQASTGKPYCNECSAGQYRAGDAVDDDPSKCSACPVGWSSPTGQTECEKCSPGMHAAVKGLSSCMVCPPGQFTNLTRASVCEKCPKGFYIPASETEDTKHDEQIDCKACQIFTYSDTEGSDRCFECRTAEMPASKTCDLCDAGMHTDKKNQSAVNQSAAVQGTVNQGCRACPKGWFQSTAGSDACDLCSPGKYAAKARSKRCTVCGRGLFTAERGANAESACRSCPPGTYSEYGGRTSEAACKKCDPGMWSSDPAAESASVCKACLSGKYGDLPGLSSELGCKECAPGTYSERIAQRAADSCAACPSGYSQRKNGSSFCLPCMPGRAQEQEQRAECQSCAQGQYQSAANASGCLVCLPGTFAESLGETSCRKCLPGMFSSAEQSAECQLCGKGLYQPAANASSCFECGAGTFSEIRGATICQDCLPGQFSDATRSERCQGCPAGQYQQAPGASSCDTPSEGRVALGGVVDRKVARGWRLVCYGDGNGDGGCNETEPCSAGRYGEDPPSAVCLNCTAGMYSTTGSQLSSSCKSCEEGKHAPIRGSPECLFCNITEGKYSDVSGAIHCKECDQDQESTRIGCVSVSADDRMPSPTDVSIRMVNSAKGAALMALNDAARGRGPKAGVGDWMSSLRVSWAVTPDEQNKGVFTDFEVRVGLVPSSTGSKRNDRIDLRTTITKAEAAENLPRGVYAAVVDTVEKVPVFERLVYVDVRTVDGSGGGVGKWSPFSESWLTTGAGKCSDPREYLDNTDPNPVAWKCVACPNGAYCENSITWRDVKAKTAFWRDDHETNATKSDLWVPRKFKFVPCPNKVACLGSEANETCDENLGYRNICDDDTGATCRLCNTCASGFSMGSDGITCFPCAPPEEKASSFAFGIFVILLLFFILGLLVFLKVKSSVRGDKEKNKAVHSTIKRIMLSHLQVITLCMSLNVPWPKLLADMMMLFSSISSVSKHVSSLGCFYDADDTHFVGKNARFLYTSAVTVLVAPFIFALVTWMYWMFLVPTCAGRALACGQQDSLTFSDPVPNVCRKVFCRRGGGGMRRTHKATTTKTALAAAPRHRSRNSKMPWQAKDEMDGGAAKTTAAAAAAAAATIAVVETAGTGAGAGAEDKDACGSHVLKTRDVWSYTNVLFLYMMYPSLCRIPFAVLSCRGIHPDVPPKERGAWADLEYLRVDMEETCWQGQHAVVVVLMAVPGILVYAIGTPLMAFVLLFRSRSELRAKKYMFRLGLLYSGYRETRWWYEGVVTLRKFFIIVAAAFLHDDALQLHLTLSVMIMAYAVHHVLMPFVPEKTIEYDDDDGGGGGGGDRGDGGGGGGGAPVRRRMTRLDKIEQRSQLKDRKTLHRLERWSIFICLSVVWSSTVFILYDDSKGERCDQTSCNLLVVGVVIANILFLCSGVALFVFHFIKRNRALRDIVGKRSRGLRKMLSARRLDRGDQPVDVDPDAEKKRRASMEEPDVEIFINPIVMKRYERGERWNKIRKQVFMPGMAISALRRAAGRGGGGGGEAKSTVKSRPVLSRKHSGRRIGRGKGVEMVAKEVHGGASSESSDGSSSESGDASSSESEDGGGGGPGSSSGSSAAAASSSSDSGNTSSSSSSDDDLDRGGFDHD